MISLQEITDLWGEWKVKQLHAKEMRYTASIDYSGHKDLEKVLYKQVKATEWTHDKFETSEPVPHGQPQHVRLQYKNNSSEKQKWRDGGTLALNTTTEWKIAPTIDFQLGSALSAVAPIVPKISLSGLSYGKTSADTGTRTWNFDFIVPGYHQAKVDIKITGWLATTKWSVKLHLRGDVALGYTNDDGAQPLVFNAIGDVITIVKRNNLAGSADLSGYTVHDDRSAEVVVTGEFTSYGNWTVDIDLATTKLHSRKTDARNTDQ